MNARLPYLCAAILLLAASQGCDPHSSCSKAASASALETSFTAEPDDPETLRTRVYQLNQHTASLIQSRAFWVSSDYGKGVPVDPFAPQTEAQRRVRERISTKEHFALHDIAFPEGTTTTLDAETQQLTVTQNAAGIASIEKVLHRIHDRGEKTIQIQLEIFELPDHLAVELGESSAAHLNHNAEWKAVDKLVNERHADTVVTLSLATGSGMRARTRSGSDYSITNADFDIDLLQIDSVNFVGTELEIDPILGADSNTLDLNFALEYHSAPPGNTTVQIPGTGAVPGKIVTLPVFHRHIVTANTETLSGEWRHIGTWRPTGNPRFQRENLMQVAFLRASVSTTETLQRIR